MCLLRFDAVYRDYFCFFQKPRSALTSWLAVSTTSHGSYTSRVLHSVHQEVKHPKPPMLPNLQSSRWEKRSSQWSSRKRRLHKWDDSPLFVLASKNLERLVERQRHWFFILENVPQLESFSMAIWYVMPLWFKQCLWKKFPLFVKYRERNLERNNCFPSLFLGVLWPGSPFGPQFLPWSSPSHHKTCTLFVLPRNMMVDLHVDLFIYDSPQDSNHHPGFQSPPGIPITTRIS